MDSDPTAPQSPAPQSPAPAYSVAALDHWRCVRGADNAVLDQADPWALPLVVHVEKVIPDGAAAPDHRSTIVASARAVATILLDPRAAPGGDWHPALARWRGGRIRKVTRRARGIRWREALAEPGVTVRVGAAEVRAHPAYPVADPPPWLKKLQVGGLDLDRTEIEPAAIEQLPAGPVLTLLLAPGVTMTTGKAAAQAGHAAQLALESLDRAEVLAWAGAGFPIRLVDRPDPLWERAGSGAVPAAVVRDGGLTEVAPGTRTAAATFAR